MSVLLTKKRKFYYNFNMAIAFLEATKTWHNYTTSEKDAFYLMLTKCENVIKDSKEFALLPVDYMMSDAFKEFSKSVKFFFGKIKYNKKALEILIEEMSFFIKNCFDANPLEQLELAAWFLAVTENMDKNGSY